MKRSQAPLIELKNVSKIYQMGSEGSKVLNNVSFRVQRGEFVAIMGPSGSGKSTLMNILGLLDTPSSGEYTLERRALSKISNTQQAKIRNKKIGFIFQMFNLLPKTSVLDNVLLPTIYGTLPHAKKRAINLITSVGLKDQISHLSNQLSGGQMQRVAIARSLIMDPALILADEPTGNLDTKRSLEIMKLFRSINKKGRTIVLITHEKEIAAFADRIISLRDGKIVYPK